ncbi:hypothetical protein AB4144_45160, partial [Rhizobiaceae sp. 2RAB30]
MSFEPAIHAGLVIRGAEIFAPEKLGKASVATVHGKIVAVGDEVSDAVQRLPDVQVIAADGLRLIPGLVDQHIHF